MRSFGFLLIIVCLFALFVSCKPKVSEDFTQKVIYLSKQQTGTTEAEMLAAKARLNDIITKSEQQAEELEKKGLFYKKIANKYLELAWLRSTIKANLPNTRQTEQPDNDSSLSQEATLTVPDEQELSSYQNALHYLLKSLDIFYSDAGLYYNAGFCAAHIGKYQKEQSDAPAGLAWYKKARQYYIRAIELDENYTEALYSLAILLVFELQEPAQGIPYLLRIKEREQKDLDARFLLAYTYYITGEHKQAIMEYSELEKLTKKPELIAQARKNKQQILDLLNQSE